MKRPFHLAERVEDLEVSIGELSMDSECVYVLFSFALVTSKFRCVVNAESLLFT